MNGEQKEAESRAWMDKEALCQETFSKFDVGNKGTLTRFELHNAIVELTGKEYSMDQVETLYEEFDNDHSGYVDILEFKALLSYFETKNSTHKREKSLDSNIFNLGISLTMTNSNDSSDTLGDIRRVVRTSRRDNTVRLQNITKELYGIKDLLCVQDSNVKSGVDMGKSMMLDFDELMDETGETGDPTNALSDPDFRPAFSASDMRCLALVSHNGMKTTMRQFVIANKNLLKKFRLTGTNSTMTMLKEVFKDEPPGTIVYGPACASGPLGGDAELVAHMVGGRIGVIIFFCDPMDSHPHRADIDCLLRQALVHNTMMAETPTSALMLLQCLRMALEGEGRPELIPSFFFSLQSPTVEAYKKNQRKMVEEQKKMVRKPSIRMSAVPGSLGLGKDMIDRLILQDMKEESLNN
mmetsp:Transcript_22516/g.45937  ORF Transcript_22516/g.45937 Transcript_22516/m.45937 type:complete len:410 (+) Transcript_22516:304-1533(+)